MCIKCRVIIYFQTAMNRLFLIQLFFLLALGAVHAQGVGTLRGLALDPKTVANKEIGDGNQQQQPHDYSNLKFLVFGTSRAYGSGIKDRENDPFAKQLSKAALNLGIPASTSEYPSQCVSSMLSSSSAPPNDAFDVIILEYPNDPTHYFPNTIKLAQRLRQRFPEALIIFMELWIPLEYNHIPTGKNVFQWAGEQQQQEGADKMSVSALVQERTKPEEWEFGPQHEHTVEQLQEITQPSVQGHYLKVARPANAHTAMAQDELFLPDFSHPTVKGHKFVAHQVVAALDQLQFRRHHVNTVHPYDRLDQCTSWYTTGSTTLTQEGFQMNEFKTGKFALEMTGQDGWIQINNANTKPFSLAIEFMTTSPDCFYPTVQISMDNDDGANTAAVEVKCRELKIYKRAVHVLEQLQVGSIPPGHSKIRLHAVDTMSKWPFRLVGIQLTEEACNNSYGKHGSGALRCSSHGEHIFLPQ